MATARVPKGSRRGGQFTAQHSAAQITADLALAEPSKEPLTVRSENPALPLSLTRKNGLWSVTEELAFTSIGAMLASVATEKAQSKIAYRCLLSNVLANYANTHDASEAHMEAMLSIYGTLYETGGSAANLPTAVRAGVIDTLLSVTENLANKAAEPVELDRDTRMEITAHGFPGGSVADLAKRKVVTGLFNDILRRASHPGPFSAAEQSNGRYKPESAAAHYDRCHALTIHAYATDDPLSMDHRVLLLLSQYAASSDSGSFRSSWRMHSPVAPAISNSLVVPFTQVLRSTDGRDIDAALAVLREARTIADEDAANGDNRSCAILAKTGEFLSALELADKSAVEQQRFQTVRSALL